jgi:uncharacterized membrane protein (UPF0127 family)
VTARRAAALALALLSLGCCRSSPPAASLAAQPRLVLESPSGRSSAVRLEIARTPAELERGLMFRREMGSDDGMLFVFGETADHTFWMKDTYLPLDMIFMDAGGTVVGIVEGAEPLTTTPRRVGAPSRYVLEVNGGWSAAHGVAAGDRARFEGIPGVP